MGAPAVRADQILMRLGEIETAICSQPCEHPECDMTCCTHPLKLLRELMEQVEELNA